MVLQRGLRWRTKETLAGLFYIDLPVVI